MTLNRVTTHPIDQRRAQAPFWDRRTGLVLVLLVSAGTWCAGLMLVVARWS